VTFSKSATLLLAAQAAVIALTLLARFWILTGLKIRGTWFHGMAPMIRSSLLEGMPFGIAQVFQAMVFTAPSIIISLLAAVKMDLAVFQGAHRINVAIYTLCGTLGTSLYASISSSIAKGDRQLMDTQMTKTLHMLCVASFAWAVTVYIFGDDVARRT
jgi:O-antigen/teichoic acid export membrane protein